MCLRAQTLDGSVPGLTYGFSLEAAEEGSQEQLQGAEGSGFGEAQSDNLVSDMSQNRPVKSVGEQQSEEGKLKDTESSSQGLAAQVESAETCSKSSPLTTS